MKIAKILTALILVLCMLLALCACGTSQENNEGDNEAEKTTVTTKVNPDLPDPPADDDDDGEETPDPVAQNVDDDISGRPVLKVDAENATAENLNMWGAGGASYAFDDDVSISKIGGDIPTSNSFTVSFRTLEPSTAEYYVFYTGGDTTIYPLRNPIAWTLYGSLDGETYTELDVVEDSDTSVCGLEVVDSVPFVYKLDNPAEYLFYKIEFTVIGTQFQLNEIQLIGSAG